MRLGLIGALVAAAAGVAAPLPAQPLPRVADGRIERLANVPSRHVDARHVDVWLPPGYDGTRRFPVLYMHDGQMLFDGATTWNRQEWTVDETLARLVRDGTVPPVIVVGVFNAGRRRHSEYFPERALAALPAGRRDTLVRAALDGRPRADAYLRFLVEELKPLVDRRFATKPDAANTFVMGSSMGGLISLYALCEYPQVFGGAAALSTHWVGTGTANATIPLAFLTYLRDRLPDPASHRLYLDIGTTTLDSLYLIHQPVAERVARDRGYGPGTLLARTYPGADHSERSWAARLAVPLRFLLAADTTAAPPLPR